MANLRGFDANYVDPRGDFEPIPAGKYVAAITESEMKPTKSGSGQYLQLTFQVLEGPHQGRFLWARLNLDNPNATACKIAQAELSAICRAVNVLTPQDSCELHDIPLVVNVRCRKRPDTDDVENVIKGYSRRDGAAPVATAPTATAGTAAPASNTPPWKRA